jgi:multidrug resistance efflux pump
MTMASLRLLRPRAFPATFDWRRNMRPILLIAVPALVVIAALMFWLQGGRYASTENAYVKADIAQIASEVQGRIAEGARYMQERESGAAFHRASQ